MSPSVLLINPKYPHNVGGAVRACGAFGIHHLRWTGTRVDPSYSHRRISTTSAGRAGPRNPRKRAKKMRLPREERVREWQNVDWDHTDDYELLVAAHTPVCIELLPGTVSLVDFEHPEDALYIFGPEDSGVPKGMRHACHHFVQVPTLGCLNLAATVNVVLYDRMAKLTNFDHKVNDLQGAVVEKG
jgi:tRNA(Leu) C34 or U34 (ribose-2'-O)-methylase TrmL